jgi:hydroxymethylbilane synthase
MSTLQLGTRASPLALVQARWTGRALERAHPGLTVELVTITTSGDRFRDRPLMAIGGKALFVKEIEEALLAGAIDLAVHSMKDLPTELPDGLGVSAIPRRADPADVLITRDGRTLAALPAAARVGTSSLRRAALVLAQRPDLAITGLRGNVDTRLARVADGTVDATLLAAAGLARLGRRVAGAHALDPETFVPAVGQGALAIETRSDHVAALVGALDDPETRAVVTAERAFLRRVGGSCHTPLGAFATLADGRLTLRAVVVNPDGSAPVRGQISGPATGADTLGTELADTLLADGAAAILAALDVSAS